MSCWKGKEVLGQENGRGGHLTHTCLQHPPSGPCLNRGQIPFGLNGTMVEGNSGLERVPDVWSPVLHSSALPRTTLVSQLPSGRVGY